MNAPVTFNTPAFVRRPEAAGMDPRQAEAMADAFGDALQEVVATKADVAELGGELRGEIQNLRGDLRETELRLQKDIKDLELRLTTRLGASAVVVVAILGTLISLHH